MVTMSQSEWSKYRDLLKKLSDTAADEFRDAVYKETGRWGGVGLSKIPREEILDYAYALVTKYGEGASAAACEWYDAIAELSNVVVDPAEPAELPDFHEIAKAVNGAMKSGNADVVAGAIGRQVKMAGQDTTLNNAIRDGAQVGWITAGDTCAFCVTLASRGFETASKNMVKHGHAKHIHANCDCFYAVRFDDDTEYEGYNPEEFRRLYDAAPGDDAKEKINAIRREFYKENSEEINAQKRSAYEKRQERESSAAEEIVV